MAFFGTTRTAPLSRMSLPQEALTSFADAPPTSRLRKRAAPFRRPFAIGPVLETTPDRMAGQEIGLGTVESGSEAQAGDDRAPDRGRGPNRQGSAGVGREA